MPLKSKIFKKIDYVITTKYEVEVAKAQMERKETITVEFFILPYAKLQILELYYNIFCEIFRCKSV